MENNAKISFELYRIFYVTARCGNITQAARELYLTQPSVTKHIHTLEEELGQAVEGRQGKRAGRGIGGTFGRPEGRVAVAAADNTAGAIRKRNLQGNTGRGARKDPAGLRTAWV